MSGSGPGRLDDILCKVGNKGYSAKVHRRHGLPAIPNEAESRLILEKVEIDSGVVCGVGVGNPWHLKARYFAAADSAFRSA